MIARAGDLLYTFRFLTLLVTPFERTGAFKEGIIDKNGNRQKDVELETNAQKSVYTHFHRMVFNIKKILAKAPGGKTTVGSYAAALYLIKEKLDLSDNSMEKIIEKCGHKKADFIAEENTWFILENNELSSGLYKIKNSKVVNSTIEEVVKAKDQIRIVPGCFPVGNICGINVYEALHVKTKQNIYITVEEII